MKSNKKRKMIIIIITMVVAIISINMVYTVQAESAEAETWDISADDDTSKVTATLYNYGRMVISGTGNMKEHSLTELGIKKNDIKVIEIQQGITNIGKYAFEECTDLEQIIIPNSVINIERDAFYRCISLESIVIPNSIQSIKTKTFELCDSLIDVTIPNSVTNIEKYAFQDCKSLKTIEIPASVNNLESEIFDECTSLTSINVDSENADYISKDGVVFSKDETTLIQFPPAKKDTIYTIPNSVTSIGEAAFENCINLTTVNISNNVKSIGRRAFYKSTGLISIEIPKSINTISSEVFSSCSNLTTVKIPNSVIEIKDEIFYLCTNLKNIDVDANNQNYISENGILFNKNKTKLIKYPPKKEEQKYTVPDTVTEIASFAFQGCENLIDVKISNNVVKIGISAFSECINLININIPEGISNIQNSMFQSCKSLKNISIPSSVKDIGRNAFYGVKFIYTVNDKNDSKVKVPNLIKRAIDESDSLYSQDNIILTNCSFDNEKEFLILDTNKIRNGEFATIKMQKERLKLLYWKVLVGYI